MEEEEVDGFVRSRTRPRSGNKRASAAATSAGRTVRMHARRAARRAGPVAGARIVSRRRQRWRRRTRARVAKRPNRGRRNRRTPCSYRGRLGIDTTSRVPCRDRWMRFASLKTRIAVDVGAFDSCIASMRARHARAHPSTQTCIETARVEATNERARDRVGVEPAARFTSLPRRRRRLRRSRDARAALRESRDRAYAVPLATTTTLHAILANDRTRAWRVSRAPEASVRRR